MARAIIAAIALLGFGAAQAEDAVVVRRESNPAGTVVRDTIAGGVLGSAVAGGIILYQREVNDKKNYNWQRTLAWGAGIGLATGLVWGIVDAASGPTTYGSVAHAHDGLSASLDRESMPDPSGALTFPVALGRF